MGLTFVDPETKPEKKQHEPERWKNRFEIRAGFLMLTCQVCGEQLGLAQGDVLVSPHCAHWPSRDVAETIAAEEVRRSPHIIIYLGAERAD